jgi:hypothetical protein
MSRKPDPQSGRVTYDERGQPVWEWRVGAGVFSREVDTVQVKQLQEAASVKLEPAVPPPVEGFDPYSSSTTRGAPNKPRRTLDDMRKLSEEIKKNRRGK